MTRAKDISKILTDANISGTLDVTGETTLATHLNLGDNDKIKLGASADLQIYHNGSASYISEQGTGNLVLGAADSIIFQNAAHDENMLVASQNGAVSLYHDNSIKIATTSGGVTVTGGVTTTTASSIEGGVVFNESSADVDFRVESNGNANMIFVDGGNNRVGVGGTPTTFPLELFGGNGDGLVFKESTNSVTNWFGALNAVATIGTTTNHQLALYTSGYERARILGPSTSHSGFFKISDSGSYQGSTSGFHEIRTSSSNQAGVVIGASHASFAANVISIITQRANSSSFRYIQGLSSNTGDTDYSVRGDGEVFADGSFNSGGADYAEMFEWKDGNTSSEDRVGKTVVLDGNQIRLSTSDDAQATIIGVVSARPVVLGDAQSEKWKDKYETDSYGRYVFEEYTQTEWTIETDDGAKELKSYQTDMIPSDVTVPDDAIVTSKDENGDNLKRRKLNSAFDASKTYISREDRKEFSAIGLVGKLRVNVGQTIGDRWIKMREISDTVHEYLVR